MIIVRYLILEEEDKAAKVFHQLVDGFQGDAEQQKLLYNHPPLLRSLRTGKTKPP